jgi:membrane protein YdbS with pleckstrin-like domain
MFAYESEGMERVHVRTTTQRRRRFWLPWWAWLLIGVSVALLAWFAIQTPAHHAHAGAATRHR